MENHKYLALLAALAGSALAGCASLLGDFTVDDASVGDDGSIEASSDVAGDRDDSAAFDAVDDHAIDANDSPIDAGTDVGSDVVVDAGCVGVCPVALAAGQIGQSPPGTYGGLGAIATDGSNVYWTRLSSSANAADGQVLACPVSGCPSGPKALATGQASPTALAVSNGFLYWTNSGTNAKSFSDATVMKCATGGCPSGPTVLASGSSVAGTDIAVDGVNVYWTVYDGVYVCPISGCATSPTPPTLVPHDGGFPGQPAAGIALDPLNAYWTGGQGILQCPKFGCSKPTLVASSQYAGGVSVTGTAVVWDEGISGQSIVTCRVASCTPTTIATAPTKIGIGLAADSTGVYWGGQGLHRCPISGCGGASGVLVGYDAGIVGDVALDNTNAYFIAGGAVLKVPK